MASQNSLMHSNRNLFSKTPPSISYFIFLIFLSIVTIILDHKYQKLEQVRTVINTILSPIYFISNVPSITSLWIDDNLSPREKIITQRQSLVHENLLLGQFIQQYNSLEIENQRLRDLLNMSKKHKHDRVQIASVLLLDKNRNPNEITLDKGLKDNVYLGQSVLDTSGLLGQIIHVAYQTSTVLLLTSPKSFAPAQITRNSYRGTIMGNGLLDFLQLIRIPENADVKIGDIITTSGIGGTFPKGYRLGKVISIVPQQDHFLAIKVKAFAGHDRIQEVLLIWSKNKLHNISTSLQ